ncbi:MAG: hypothetical protein WCK89_20560, partial [bacterium]
MHKLGGSEQTESAVERALAWLAANQEPDGRWALSKTGGSSGHDAAGTGFALLTFLGRGVKPGDGSPYSGVVSNALSWLVGNAKLNGDMRVGGNMYDQGIATLALTEAYGLIKDEKLKEPVQAAVNFIVDAQHEDGGWRYTPKEAGDLSVSGWQIMALKSAELSGLMISETCLAKTRSWLREKMASGPHGGLYSYTAGASSGQPAMQAAGFFCSQLLGPSPNSVRARDHGDALVAYVLDSGKAGIYYWYNAVLGSYQYQGPFWQAWNKRLIEYYLPAQRRDGALAGSWDPSSHQHGDQMGRVIVTAMCTLSLEVYYRYTPLYGLGYDPQARTTGSDGWDAERISKVPLYRRARPAEALNSPAEEQRPSFTRRGDFVYFASNRRGGAGGYDLYRARVNPAQEAAPERLGPEINTAADETSPALRLNGFQLLFTSNRDGVPTGAPHLYVATSRYVRAFHDYTLLSGLGDQLLKLQGHLLLLAAALCSILLFTRQCRRSVVEARLGAVAWTTSPQRAEKKPALSRRRRNNVLAWVGLLLSGLTVAGLLGSLFFALRSTIWCRYTDDVAINKRAVDVTPRPVVWDFPAPLSRHTTGLVERSSLQLTPDGAGLLLSRASATTTGMVQVLTSSWNGYEWSPPVPVEGVNRESNTQDAVITRDGTRLFFASDRAGGFGGYDLWTAVRHNGLWIGVTNLGASVNTSANECSPAPSPDGTRLYFASDRTARPQKDFDLFAADILASEPVTNAAPPVTATPAPPLPKPAAKTKRTTKRAEPGVVAPAPSAAPLSALGLSSAAPLEALNTPANETQVSLTERGDWLYFASDREPGSGRFDVYSARVLDQQEVGVATAGSEINTSAEEQGPAAGREGFQLLFNSDRGANRAAELRPFAANACEVEGRWDFSRWYSLGNLLHALRWWILLGLAALAGILYILTHLKELTSLRAKCMIVSLLLHLVFLLLTALWIISSQFIESSALRNQELSVNIDALAQEKIALDVREKILELPQSKDTLVAEQAEEALPVPDFKPVQPAVQTVVARNVTESFVADTASPAETPEPRVSPAAKLPDLPEIRTPMPDITLKVEKAPGSVSEAKAAETFQPLADRPSVSTAQAEVTLPGPVADFTPLQPTV